MEYIDSWHPVRKSDYYKGCADTITVINNYLKALEIENGISGEELLGHLIETITLENRNGLSDPER